MGIATTIGLDIAKSVFQVHGVDAAGEVVTRRKLTRGRVLGFFENLPRCLVGIEACSSSHYWARELIARGHDVRLLPAQYVKPYLKRQKNDAADAEAICEAVTRPTMRFVPVKTPEQQSVMMLHRVRLMLNRQRTQISNALRAHLSEFGVVAPIGRNGIEQLLVVINDDNDTRIPADARLCLRMLEAQLGVVKEQILENDRRVRASARETELGRRLMEIPGVGPLLASAFVATVADAHAFKSSDASQPGSGSFPSRTQAGARRSSAASPKPEIAICARCSWSARWR
jgi:transposase